MLNIQTNSTGVKYRGKTVNYVTDRGSYSEDNSKTAPK